MSGAQYWVNAYSEIDTIDKKLSILEKCGYTPVAHFVLDNSCYMDNYYKPILDRSEAFLKKYNYSAEVKEFVEAGKIEAEMYERYNKYYSYALSSKILVSCMHHFCSLVGLAQIILLLQ